MGKQNLRAIVESIVIEALEEWMDECDDCDDLAEADKVSGEKTFGGGAAEKKPKKPKKPKKSKKKDPVASSKYNRDRRRSGPNNSD